MNRRAKSFWEFYGRIANVRFFSPAATMRMRSRSYRFEWLHVPRWDLVFGRMIDL